MKSELIKPVGRLRHVVRAEDTARCWGNELPVLATPVLLWLGEMAAMAALSDAIEDDEMSVGVAHDSHHAAPTLEGAEVRVEAVPVDVGERHVTFQVRASDHNGVVFSGTHSRGIVKTARFLARLDQLARDAA
jgi:fluoroacetyl-CoA thioesterase